MNMLICFDTFRRELFTVDYWIHDNETPKTGLLRLCLFKQNNITKDSCLIKNKTTKPSGKKKDVQVRECIT